MALFAIFDLIFGRGELHLAKINDAIRAINKKVDLRTIMSSGPRDLPGSVIRNNPGNAQRLLYPVDMLQAETFEG